MKNQPFLLCSKNVINQQNNDQSNTASVNADKAHIETLKSEIVFLRKLAGTEMPVDERFVVDEE